MEWRVEVPSSGRADVIGVKTLPMLRAGGVPDRAVRVWVPEGQRDEYFEACRPIEVVPLDYEPRVGPVEDGPFGLGIARNAIMAAASPGDLVVECDDDLRALDEYAGMVDGINARVEPVEDLAGFIDYAWQVAEDAGAAFWGVYGAAASYCRPRVRIDLRYVIGQFFGVRVRGEALVERVVLDHHEDYERTLRFYERDGRVVRFDGHVARSDGHAGRGGLQDLRTPEWMEASAAWVLARWPQYAKLHRPPNGRPEIRVADRAA